MRKNEMRENEMGENTMRKNETRKNTMKVNAKKVLLTAMGMAMVLSATACGNHAEKEADSVNKENSAAYEPIEYGNMNQSEDALFNQEQIPNPFTDCSTLTEAIGIAGFDMTAPDAIEGYPDEIFRVLVSEDGNMLELIYEPANATEDVTEEVRIRKAPGAEDISGDYNEYEQTTAATVDGTEVTMKGNGETVNLAVWSNEGYTYSVFASNGISVEAMTDLVAAVK